MKVPLLTADVSLSVYLLNNKYVYNRFKTMSDKELKTSVEFYSGNNFTYLLLW